MQSSQRRAEIWTMTTASAADSRTSASSHSRADRQVHAELERRLEAHLLIARRIRGSR